MTNKNSYQGLIDRFLYNPLTRNMKNSYAIAQGTANNKLKTVNSIATGGLEILKYAREGLTCVHSVLTNLTGDSALTAGINTGKEHLDYVITRGSTLLNGSTMLAKKLDNSPYILWNWGFTQYDKVLTLVSGNSKEQTITQTDTPDGWALLAVNPEATTMPTEHNDGISTAPTQTDAPEKIVNLNDAETYSMTMSGEESMHYSMDDA